MNYSLCCAGEAERRGASILKRLDSTFLLREEGAVRERGRESGTERGRERQRDRVRERAGKREGGMKGERGRDEGREREREVTINHTYLHPGAELAATIITDQLVVRSLSPSSEP